MTTKTSKTLTVVPDIRPSRTLAAKINKSIEQLNKMQVPVLFSISGNNGTGKTLLTKRLMKDLDFYQVVSLGVVSKALRIFKPDAHYDGLENYAPENQRFFDEFLKLTTKHYAHQGVNTIFEGVQIRSDLMDTMPEVLGGVVLSVDSPVIVTRSEHAQTRLNRKIRKIVDFRYATGHKYREINNSGAFNDTVTEVYSHLLLLIQEHLASKKHI